MTKNEMRIAVAESVGFAFVRSEISGGIEQWHDCDGEIVHTLPDSPQDLNAMHEMEKTLKEEEQATYAQRLVACNWLPQTGKQVFRITHATALQRCKAYLRVKGLWKND